MEIAFSGQVFIKFLLLNFMKIHRVGAELYHADGRTDMAKFTVAFRTKICQNVQYVYL
jgi:hypothetical protein